MTSAQLRDIIAGVAPEIVLRDADVCIALIEQILAECAFAERLGAEQLARAAIASVPDDTALDDHLRDAAHDLPLVAACAAGDSTAIIEFEREYFRALRPALRQMQLSNDVIDEVTQLVRQKLFVAKQGARAPILDYVGRGNLANFVRVIAMRTAISLLRKRRAVSTDDDSEPLLEASEPADTPQMRLLKAKHADDFKQAFELAISRLDAQQRNLLRMSFVEKLSVDDIGRFYNVHRATAARRVARARARLAELTRAILRERLTLDEGEFTSIVRLVHSGLDLSITRVLGD